LVVPFVGLVKLEEGLNKDEEEELFGLKMQIAYVTVSLVTSVK
jgi:hypothetical protein